MTRRRLALLVGLAAAAAAAAVLAALGVFSGGGAGPFRTPTVALELDARSGSSTPTLLRLTTPLTARWAVASDGKTGGSLSADAVVRLWSARGALGLGRTAANLELSAQDYPLVVTDARSDRTALVFELDGAPGAPARLGTASLSIVVPTASVAAAQTGVIAAEASLAAQAVPPESQATALRATYDAELTALGPLVQALSDQIAAATRDPELASPGQRARLAGVRTTQVAAVTNALATARNAVGKANPNELAALTQQIAERLDDLAAALETVESSS